MSERATYRIAVGLVFAAFLAACLHGIANHWRWGHNGYNGASFSQAARNSLRFGTVGQALYWTGLTAPPPSELYTHHPLMLHVHLVAGYAVFGQREWVGRLVPAAYSFLVLVMIFVLGRRLWGRWTALVAAAIFVLTPMNAVVANMINHEQGGMFWCLALVWAYLRWREGHRRRDLLLALAAVTMATQFDWPGYYVAFFLALHALAEGLLRGPPPPWRWRPEYTWAAALSGATLANAMAFFGWIVHARGSLAGMKAAFALRTQSPEGYLGQLLERAADLHTVPFLLLLAAWALLAIGRTLRGRASMREFVPALFVAVQAVHSLVFRQAGHIHSYWTYWLGPAIALGGADVAASAFALVRRSWRRWPVAWRVVPAAALALLIAAQARVAWARVRWAFATGAAAYVVPYPEQSAEIEWAKEAAKRFPRGTAAFVIHPSVQAWRIEFVYYLDAPVRGGLRPRRGEVLLADLHGVADPREAKALAGLASVYPVATWDRRFLAVDARRPGAAVEGFLSRERPAPFWWRWLVDPGRAPAVWERDPDPRGALAR